MFSQLSNNYFLWFASKTEEKTEEEGDMWLRCHATFWHYKYFDVYPLIYNIQVYFHVSFIWVEHFSNRICFYWNSILNVCQLKLKMC
jgi:hypothetical protein